MNTQGTHKPFPIDNMGFESTSVRAWPAPAPRRRRPSKAWRFGYWRGRHWARQPIDWLPGAAGWNVFLSGFPAKMPVVLLKGSNPRRHGTTTTPLDKAIWHCSWSWPGCSKFLMAREAEEKERAVVRHEYDGQYCHVFLKKMRWCHHEDVAVLVLNSKI